MKRWTVKYFMNGDYRHVQMEKKDLELCNMEIQHAIYNAEPKRLIGNFLLDKYLAQFQAVSRASADNAVQKIVEYIEDKVIYHHCDQISGQVLLTEYYLALKKLTKNT